MVVGIKFAIIDTVLMMTMVYVFTCDQHRLDSELIIPFNASTKVSIKAGMDRISMHAYNSWIYSPEPRTIIMASIAIILCCALMLVVGTATAYPMRKEKFTNQDFVKAARYFWNENMGRDQHARAQEDVGKYQRAQEDIMGKYQRTQEDIMDQWNKEAEFEKEHQNDVYATRDAIDSEDDGDSDKGRNGDRATNERDDKKDTGDSEVESGIIEEAQEDPNKAKYNVVKEG